MNKDLKKFFESTEKEVRSVILRELNRNTSDRFRELWEYQINTGGKRIRPALLVASALMCGAKKRDVLLPAAALEVVHNYTLIVDDVIDKSETRRGLPTCWKKFGKKVAHCIGMGYATTYGNIISKIDKEVGNELTCAAKIITEGELIDILQERGKNEEDPYIKKNKYKKIGMEDYYEMIEKKTGHLIRAACKMGGIIAKTDKRYINFLEVFGKNIGIAFQIRDDFLDIFGDEKKFGKKIGKDIIERKGGNIVILLTLEETKRKKELLSILEKEEIKKQDVEVAMEIINSGNAKERTKKLIKKFTDNAEKVLCNFPDNYYRGILSEIKNYLATRDK